MRTTIKALLGASLLLGGSAAAQRLPRQQPVTTQQRLGGAHRLRTSQELAGDHGLDVRLLRRLVREVNAANRQAVRDRGALFRKITVARDYRGEHVLLRDAKVTAFLDMTDPKHPRFDPEIEVDEELESIPANRRAHILVVPNTPREHIGPSLGGPIGAGDLEATLEVVKSAEALAAKLGLKNPRVFVNAQDRLLIGYLHVHIVGERDPKDPYPAALKP